LRKNISIKDCHRRSPADETMRQHKTGGDHSKCKNVRNS
jgi:hypothetical protein